MALNKEEILEIANNKNRPTISLTTMDGNAFILIGESTKLLKRAHINEPKIEEFITTFHDEITSGDYDHVVQTIMKYCDVA